MAAVTFIKAVIFIKRAVTSIKGAILFIGGAVISIKKAVTFIGKGGLAIGRSFKIARVKVDNIRGVNKRNLK